MYSNYLLRKKIVIVGPAPSIIGSKQGDLINSYDIVVRINKALPIPEHLKIDIGSKTDVLYNCLNTHPENGGKIDQNLLKKNNVKYICCPYPPIEPFKNDIINYLKINTIPFHHINQQYYNKLVLELNSRPNSGVAAILDILQYPIKELYITGFTFFKGGYYKDYRPYSEKEVLNRMNKAGNHDQKKQLEYMKNILKKDNRVKMDNELKKIIYSS